MQLADSDLHPHLRARMNQRGVVLDEINTTLIAGWPCEDAKADTDCRMYVFRYEKLWEGKFYQEKEVTVYFKETDEGVVVLTVKVRYGRQFPRQKD